MQFNCTNITVFLQLMKVTTYIFTIYILALSFVPCSDGGGGMVEIVKHFFGVEHHHVSDHEQHSKDCGDDACTPFCVCSCCSIAVDIPPKLFFKVEYLPPILSKLQTSFSDFIPSSFHTSIWQPPRFS